MGYVVGSWTECVCVCVCGNSRCVCVYVRELKCVYAPVPSRVQTQGTATWASWAPVPELKSSFGDKDGCVVAVMSRLCVSFPLDTRSRFGTQRDLGVYHLLLVSDVDPWEVVALRGPALRGYIETSGKVKVRCCVCVYGWGFFGVCV